MIILCKVIHTHTYAHVKFIVCFHKTFENRSHFPKHFQLFYVKSLYGRALDRSHRRAIIYTATHQTILNS